MTIAENRQFWRDHLTQWQDAGMTQLAYCRRHELCPHKFSYYKRVLVTRAESAPEENVLVTRSESAPEENVLVTRSESPPENPSGFVSVQVLPQPGQPDSLILHLNNGLSLSGIATDNLGLVKQLAQVLS